MNALKPLLYAAMSVGTLSIAISCVTIYLLWRQRQYFERIMNYANGLADIHATIKAAILEHHDIMIEHIDNEKLEILRHVTFVNRWQKVIAKLIKIKGAAPLELATGSETAQEAAVLHEVGLEIAKVAFEDKIAMESEAEEPPDKEAPDADNNNKP